jgi:hypothetical protein
MPWKASSVMEERLRFLARLLDGEAMTEVCREFGISRKIRELLVRRLDSDVKVPAKKHYPYGARSHGLVKRAGVPRHRARQASVGGHRRTDMRKGFGGLVLLVQETLTRDPHGGHLFVFRGRRGNLIKVLWHDGQGMRLFSKRLERGRFIWPSPADRTVAKLNDVYPQARLADVLRPSRACGAMWRDETNYWQAIARPSFDRVLLDSCDSLSNGLGSSAALGNTQKVRLGPFAPHSK